MDVSTPDEAESPRSTAVLAVALSAVLVAPGVVVPAYARAGAALVLAAAAAVALRVAVATIAAAVRRSPPEPPEEWPDVSVVVTAYNEADVLAATVAACARLDYPEDALEVLVCYEAASEDATAAVARAAAARDPRVRAVERCDPPAGKAAAVNHGVACASGDVIASLDADQRPEPGALRRAVRWFENDDVWCVKGRCFGTNPDSSLLALCVTVERAVAERAVFPAGDLLGGFAPFTGGQAFFRADALDAVGPFDESILLEDIDVAHRIGRAGGEVRVDPGVVTAERNPATLAAWWNQRKRWARGGMQVARRYLGRELLSGPPSPVVRLDFATTFGGLLAAPVLLAAGPLVPLSWWLGAGTPPGPALAALAAILVVPVAAPYVVFALDARDGRRHALREYLAPPLLWGYFALQAAAVVVAFVEAFVLRRPAVYVTSTEPDERGGRSS